MSDKVNIDSKKNSDNSGDVRSSESSGRTGRSGQSGRTGRRWHRFPRSWSEVKSLGWKFILAFILFYLIRDGILYILLPYLLYEGIISL